MLVDFQKKIMLCICNNHVLHHRKEDDTHVSKKANNSMCTESRYANVHVNRRNT